MQRGRCKHNKPQAAVGWCEGDSRSRGGWEGHGQDEGLQGLVQASLPGSSGGCYCRISCSATAKEHRDFPASQDEQKEQRLEDKQESSLHLCCRITPDFIQVSDPPGFCLILAVSPVFIALQFRDPIHESKLPPPASTSSLLTPELQGLQRNVPGAAWLQPTTPSSKLLGRAAGSKHFTFQPSGAH